MVKRNRKTGNPNHIPQYPSQPVLSRTMRYQCTAAQSAVTYAPTRLLASLGTVCRTANTDCTVIYEACKVKRIRLWAATSASGTAATISVNFGNYAFNVNTEYIDTTISVSEMAHLDVRPPKGTLASFWHTYASTDVLFTITCPSGTIMDIDYDMVQSDNDPSVRNMALSSGAATLGLIYYINLSASSTAFSPMQLITNW